MTGLEKGERRRGKERGIALSHFSPSPPLPSAFLHPPRRARKALEIAFSWARYSGGPKLSIFQTEVPILLKIVIYCGGYSGALARAKRSTMGKKLRLSMHPRNLGSEKIVGTCVHPTHVSRVEILHFKDLGVSGINRIAARTFRDKQQQQQKRFLIFMSILA